MAKKKSIEELSSDELYKLAKKKEAEERERQRQAMRAELEAAKAERRALLARHKKELAAVDAKIRKLGGRVPTRGSASGGRGNISNAVLDILSDKKRHSTKQIKEELAKRGVVAANLNQTLAYLKRQGKVKNPARSVYTAA